MTKATLSEVLRVNRYDTDKGVEYLRTYENCFEDLRMTAVALMEVGINKGGSLLMWRDYFPEGNIVGIDVNPPAVLGDETGRIHMFQCDQADAERLHAIASQASPTGFDVIIDDASHIASLTATTFRSLFYKHLKPGGFYAIEDWGTGYWNCWPDGAWPEHLADLATLQSHGHQFLSHQSGMVGLLKQLIDECALTDIFHPRFGVPGARKSYIRSMRVLPGLVILEKAV